MVKNMKKSIGLTIVLAVAIPVITLAGDKQPEEHKAYKQPSFTLPSRFYRRLSALRFGPEVEWIARDIQQIPQTVRNRLQDCYRRRIKGE